MNVLSDIIYSELKDLALTKLEEYNISKEE